MTKRATKTRSSHQPRSAGGEDKEMGARMRLRRVEIGLSQDELGQKLGVSFQQIQKYEKGMNRVSSVRTKQIARALDTTPNFLLGWNDKNTHTQLDVGVWRVALEMKDLTSEDVEVVRATVRALLAARRK